MSDSNLKTNYPALYTLVLVFFFWGFIAAGNSIFIPFCKSYFSLDQFQSQLVDFAFYTAYYLGALILFAFGNSSNKDLVSSWGYKKSIVYGLLFSAFGAAAMIVAVEVNLYVGMLVGLFIVALGFSLQQTAANPFAISLGDPKTGADRVNLGGGINSFGATIGPLIIAFALFGSAQMVTESQIKLLSLNKVVILYACVGVLFLIAAAMFFFSKKVPAGITSEKVEKSNKALTLLLVLTVLLGVCFTPVFNSYKSEEAIKLEKLQAEYNLILEQLKPYSDTQLQTDVMAQVMIETRNNLSVEIKPLLDNLEYTRMYWLIAAFVAVIVVLLSALFFSKKSATGWGAMQYPQLVLGMLAIFLYVGVEVAVGSNLGELLTLKEFGGLSSSEIAPYISMYWGSLMIGRWAGAVSVFKLSDAKKQLLIIVVPFIALAVIFGANLIAKQDMSNLYYYFICVIFQIIALKVSKNKPARTLMVFAVFGMIAMFVGLITTGMVAIYAFLCGGLACSIMWPAIFNLSLLGLGKYTSQGSAFLVMMILGGGIIPPIQGKMSDIIGIHQSYILSFLCFTYLFLFAIGVRKILLKQNINIDE
nr:MFS transporter [uncultured Flavobacterium sp.]